MKRIFISIFLAICSISVFADGVWIDNIYYNLNKSTHEAEVADFQFSESPGKIKSIDFNTYDVGDMPCTNKKISASQLAKIANIKNEGINALNIPSQGKVNIIERFEVDPNATYTITFMAMSDKDAAFKVNFSGNEVLGTGTDDGKWVLLSGKWTRIVVVAKSPEDVTEGFLEVEMVRGSHMNIQKVDVNFYEEKNIEIPEKIISKEEVYKVSSIGKDAFYECHLLSSLNIPNSVKNIGAGAFQGCSGLTTITIPNSVTSIGEDAFCRCTGLTTITIPNSVTSIGDEAFYGCSGLTSVTIPNSVTSIRESTFDGCTGLTSVTIPNSVTSIGDKTFYACSGLASITIPNSVTSIGWGTFFGCSGLTSITVEDGNPIYDSRDNCNAIIETSTNTLGFGFQNTIIPNSVTSIGSYAFYECTSLTSITIPNSVTSIERYAFAYCKNLTSITIPNSVTSIGDRVFSACTSLPVIDNIRYADTYLVEVVDKDCTSVNIKDGTRFIGNNAFQYCSYLISITVPNSLTSIGSYAFDGCYNVKELIYADGCLKAFRVGLTSIEKVFIPNSVTSIEDGAFGGCSGLTTIIIPNSVTSIGDYAFSSCSGLTSITIPNSVTSIGYSTFYDCSGLTTIKLPNSVTSIGEYAFSGCSGLNEITVEEGNPIYDSRDKCNAIIETSTNTLISGCKNTIIPNSITSIGSGAFGGCSGLTSITIPNSVMSIGNGTFSGCSGLTSIIIPNSVMSIGVYAFSSCECLTSITIPNSVTSIEEYTFSWCTDLNSITIGNSVTSIKNNAFYRCFGLASVTIPNSVTSIGYSAFAECTSLSSITIPNSVMSIGDGAFSWCESLATITIPNSVTSIGEWVFSGCSKLEEIHSQAKTPPTAHYDTFDGFDTNECKLYVPTGTKKDYAFADGWKEFLNIIEEEVPGGSTVITLSEINDKYGDMDFYSLNGLKVDVPSKSGIYIVKKNGEMKKVVVKK